jgi:Xaa-Pro aminopeptidase
MSEDSMTIGPDGKPLPNSPSEHEHRVSRVQPAMEERGLDGLLVTSEDEFRYLTGFNSPTWVNLTRPRFCIVP